MKKIASIDIGSNTVRLLILQVGDDGVFEEIESQRVITRLGEGMDQQKNLLKSRIDQTVEVLAGFRKTCRKLGDIPIQAVATSAVREAENRNEFLSHAREKTGITVEVIPWEEEARLTLRGVLWRIADQGRKILIFDIGGGSTEFIFAEGKELRGIAGTSLGVVRLTERFITQHPTEDDEYRNLAQYICKELAGVKTRLPDIQPELLIGTAGTVTTLAALQKNIYPYDPQKIHGSVLTRSQVGALLDNLKSKSLAERLRLKPLERGREDLIIAGTALVLGTMDMFACEHLTVSEYSLREGLILKCMDSKETMK